MSLKMITLENEWTGVMEDKPAKVSGTGRSGFAAKLVRAAQAAKQAEAPSLEHTHFLIGGVATYESDGGRYGRCCALEQWTGNPCKFLDMWLEAIRSWRDNLDQLVQPNGEGYDTAHLTAQMVAKEKINDLVKELAELA